MRYMKLGLAAVVALSMAGSAFGQGTTSSAGSTGSVTTGLNTSGGGSTGGGASGSTGGATANNTNGTASGTALQAFQAPPSIAAPSSLTNSSGNQAINTSNFLQQSYANPFYAGIRSNYIAGGSPGGFGAAAFGTSSGSGSGNGGGTIGFAGSTSTSGGRSGTGSGTGSVNLSQPGGVLIPLPRQISYQAVVRFSAPPIVPTRLQAELRQLIDVSVTNPKGVEIIMEGTSVSLKGTVADEEEARTVEGVVRLTPGVGLIKNDLVFPTTTRILP